MGIWERESELEGGGRRDYIRESKLEKEGKVVKGSQKDGFGFMEVGRNRLSWEWEMGGKESN